MKKMALILDSLDKIFPSDGKIRGGANRVGKYLVEFFANLPDVQVDIICSKSSVEKPNNINEVYVIGISPFGYSNFFDVAQSIIAQNGYDIVLTSDLFAPYGDVIVHSHTIMYKNKNCKNFFERIFQSFLRREKVEKFKKVFANKDRKIFTVSNRLAQDYIENLGFKKENVICSYPGVEQRELPKYKSNEPFTFGIVAGNAINKGGYAFLGAVLLLKLFNKKFNAKMIIAKSKKPSFMKVFIKLLNLHKNIEIMPERDSLSEFYQEIDCLVMPSVNEAFGLVLTEAASFGKPTIASSTAGSAEVISDNINGFIFERRACSLTSIFNLYKKMSAVINLSSAEFLAIQKNSYELSKKFSWENYSKNIAKSLNLIFE